MRERSEWGRGREMCWGWVYICRRERMELMKDSDLVGSGVTVC